jgi:hypothetical protein
MLTRDSSSPLAGYVFRAAGRRLTRCLVSVVAGLLGVCAALLLLVIEPHTDPSIVVIAVIIVMLAGMTTTGGVQDAITGWYLTGVGRIFEAVSNTVGLIAGVAAGLLLAQRLDINLAIRSDISMKALQLWVMLLAATVLSRLCRKHARIAR